MLRTFAADRLITSLLPKRVHSRATGQDEICAGPSRRLQIVRMRRLENLDKSECCPMLMRVPLWTNRIVLPFRNRTQPHSGRSIQALEPWSQKYRRTGSPLPLSARSQNRSFCELHTSSIDKYPPRLRSLTLHAETMDVLRTPRSELRREERYCGSGQFLHARRFLPPLPAIVSTGGVSRCGL